VSLGAVLAPFDLFKIDRAKAKISRGEAELEVRGRFALSSQSNGIDPLNEKVTINLGKASLIIQPGSFVRNDNGFRFRAKVAGVRYRVVIKDDGRFRIRVRDFKAKKSDFSGAVPFKLLIGNDFGNTQVKFDLKNKRDNDDKDRDDKDRDDKDRDDKDRDDKD
jgi:hypothetical protein